MRLIYDHSARTVFSHACAGRLRQGYRLMMRAGRGTSYLDLTRWSEKLTFGTHQGCHRDHMSLLAVHALHCGLPTGASTKPHAGNSAPLVHTGKLTGGQCSEH